MQVDNFNVVLEGKILILKCCTGSQKTKVMRYWKSKDERNAVLEEKSEE